MAVCKKELFLQRFAYENPGIVLAKGSRNARATALIVVFYQSGWVWVDGCPSRKAEVESFGKSVKPEKVGGRSTWKSPLVIEKEENLEGFLKNNLAASAFIKALEQTLSMAKRPKKEAEEIVRRAAEKIYPDYCERVLASANCAATAVSVSNAGYDNLDLDVPADDSLLANMPKEVSNEWVPLLEEAMLLPKKLSDLHGLKVEPNVKITKKWIDKMMKSLRKKGYVFA